MDVINIRDVKYRAEVFDGVYIEIYERPALIPRFFYWFCFGIKFERINK